MNDRQHSYINQLIQLGYGSTAEEVIDYLIKRSLDDLLRAGVVQLPITKLARPSPYRGTDTPP